MGVEMGCLKKAAMCASLFAGTSLGAFCQNTQPPPKPPDNSFLRNTEIIVLAKSFHSDRLTPYNEWNPGLFVKYNLGNGDGRTKPQTSIMQGAYYNSNYTVTSTIGVLNEAKIGNFGLGILAGVALYPRVQKDVTTYTTVYSMEPLKPEKSRGHKTIYVPTGKPYEYTAVEKTFKAHGIKNKFKLIPALLATFSYNMYRGSGPTAVMTYMPWRSGDSKGLFIAAFGARINPQPQ